MNIPFSSPTTIGIFGPTQVGKSFLLSQILSDSEKLFTIPPQWVLYCYSVRLSNFSEIREDFKKYIQFHEGLPNKEVIEQITKERKHGIIVLDDLMLQVCNDPTTFSLFTVGSHHLNLTVVFLGQNIFPGGRFSRSISLNLHYIILFKNLSDSLQIRCRARQIFPGKVKEFMEIFNDATSSPFGYLLIDISPSSDDLLRLRSQILPHQTTIIYQI